MAEFSLEQALLELTGLRAERQLTRKFRAPQTLHVLTAAVGLVREVQAAVSPTAQPRPDQLQLLVDGIAEVEPLARAGQARQVSDELDDAI